MNAREVYDAIQTGNRDAVQQALFELLSQVQTLATATLELAGERKLRDGADPLSMRSRAILGDFIELSREVR
jgi:hypothetical protein